MLVHLLRLIFVLSFTALGVFGCGQVLLDANQYLKSQSWIKVPASVQEARVESSTHRGTRSEILYLKYIFHFDGDERLGRFETGSGERIKWMYPALLAAQEFDTPIEIFVDPDAPQNNSYDPRPDWFKMTIMILPILFGSVVAGVFAGFLHESLVSRARREKHHHPNEPITTPSNSEILPGPWEKNSAWRSPLFQGSRSFVFWYCLMPALVLFLMSIPTCYIAWLSWSKAQNVEVLWMLIYPFLGIGFAIGAWTLLRNHKDAATLSLRLSPFPGRIGGMVAGWFEAPVTQVKAHELHVELTAQEHRHVHDHHGDHINHHPIIWQSKVHPHITSTPRGSRFWFKFELDEDLPESTLVQKNQRELDWTVSLTSENPGFRVAERFCIPVFKVQEEQPKIDPYLLDHVSHGVNKTPEKETPAFFRVFATQSHPNQNSVVFGVHGLLLTLFYFAFILGGGAMCYAGMIMIQARVYGIGVGWCFLGSLLAIPCLIGVFRKVRVYTNQNGCLCAKTYWLGIPVYRRKIKIEDVVASRATISARTENNAGGTVRYALLAKGAQGQEIFLGQGYEGLKEVQDATQYFQERFNLPQDFVDNLSVTDRNTRKRAA